MKIRNVSQEDLKRALEIVNKRFDGNVTWNRFDGNGRGFNVTLRVASSKGPGHSIGYSHLLQGGNPKRLVSACWHVHGYFFEALFSVAPGAVVISRGQKITRDGGNWQDWNAGSMMYPQRASEKCQCSEEGHKIKFGKLVMEGGALKEVDVRFIKQSDIGRCPFFIMVPEHYRADGSCKCNDPEHRKMMMKEWEYTVEDFKRAGVL